MDEQTALAFLNMLVNNSDQILELLNKEISLPNLPTHTMGGEYFWNTLADFEGWRLQQNMITHHARILDPYNVRRAWGTINGMERAMKRICASFS